MENLKKIKKSLIQDILNAKPIGILANASTMTEIVEEMIDYGNNKPSDYYLEIEEWEGDNPLIVFKNQDDPNCPTMEIEQNELSIMDFNMITNIHELIFVSKIGFTSMPGSDPR
tara:strand:- start:707 stop:1048 length:342 start_codon:yes stop_codon:yes gene_type:complete